MQDGLGQATCHFKPHASKLLQPQTGTPQGVVAGGSLILSDARPDLKKGTVGHPVSRETPHTAGDIDPERGAPLLGQEKGTHAVHTQGPHEQGSTK